MTFPNLVRPGVDTPHHGATEPPSSMPIPSNPPPQATRPANRKKPLETELSQLQVESHGAMARFDTEEHPDGGRPRGTDFAALIDTLEQVVFQLDRDGVLRTVSAAWTRLAGQDPDDVIGQTLVGHL
ncbi:MAG: PAS domain-containing protein, partial [Burkholderiales bacterium]|nr:PAS domain-containing protein [Burkholderiales bacterium]